MITTILITARKTLHRVILLYWNTLHRLFDVRYYGWLVCSFSWRERVYTSPFAHWDRALASWCIRIRLSFSRNLICILVRWFWRNACPLFCVSFFPHVETSENSYLFRGVGRFFFRSCILFHQCIVMYISCLDIPNDRLRCVGAQTLSYLWCWNLHLIFLLCISY